MDHARAGYSHRGRIIAGLPGQEWKDDEVVDARGRLVAPGLINTHCHSNENYFKGCFDNLPLELWMLFSYPLLATPRQTPREIYVRTMLGCIEMLKSGCTTVVDFLYEISRNDGRERGRGNAGISRQRHARAADRERARTRCTTRRRRIAMELLTPELKAQDRRRADPIRGGELCSSPTRYGAAGTAWRTG